ncbi:PqqD family protein [Fusicatenibacter sp.]
MMEDVVDHTFSKEKRYCANEDYIVREIAGETILVPTGASTDHFNGMMTLNETSRFLWELFRMPHTLAETVAAAQERYDDDSGSLEPDIYDFMNESVMLGFLKEEE